MFLATIARPTFDDQGNDKFSGKYPHKAKRGAAIGPAGTLITNCMLSPRTEITSRMEQYIGKLAKG